MRSLGIALTVLVILLVILCLALEEHSPPSTLSTETPATFCSSASRVPGEALPAELRIKTVIMYQNLHSPPEGFEGALKIIGELKPDMIWYSTQITGVPPVPNASSAYSIAREAGLDDARARAFAEWVARKKYALEDIREEAESVSTVYCPCILVQNLREDFNYDPITFKPIPRNMLESMALDYSKWGLPYGEEETQEYFRKKLGIPEGAVFPDITNEHYQEYLVKKVIALKNAGVKCVWLDALFTQANIAYAITHDYNHPAVKEAYMAACNLTKKIKELGLIVGTWADWTAYPYDVKPQVDFVTKTLSRREVSRATVDYKLWEEVVARIREKTNATILMVFDFGPSDNTPLAIFSQQLTPDEQRELLKQMHEVSSKLSIIPVYPVHGGDIGENARILSYGKYRYYDALAPEFKAYNTILDLMTENQSNTCSHTS